jgi:hypothetical protein
VGEVIMATHKEYSKEFCDKNLNHIADFNTNSFHISTDKLLVDLEWLLKTAPHLAYDNPLKIGMSLSKVNNSFVEYAYIYHVAPKNYKCLKISMWVDGKGTIEACAVSNCGTIEFNESKEWTVIKEIEFNGNLMKAMQHIGAEYFGSFNVSLNSNE